MLKTKEVINKDLVKEFRKHLSDNSWQTRTVGVLNAKYNIPESISFDIITLKTSLLDETSFIIYCFVDIIYNEKVNQYFTETEINTFSKSKYKVEKIKFPIRWKMIQVTDNHWIGTITVKELMKLRNAQLINYNENTQRRLTRVVSGAEEYYEITLNRAAVDGIVDSYENNSYIPNTITLNIPEESEYYYENGELVIKELSAFDILDGYHRYIAMSQIYNLNKSFDYVMELRVVSFSETKAKQFIWQEDQKTKMHKIDSDALNTNNPANQTTTMLSETSLLSDVIRRNKGIIDYTAMTQLIQVLYFNIKDKRYDKKSIVLTKNDLYKKFETLYSDSVEIFDKPWDTKRLAATMICFSNEICDSETIEKFYNIINKPEYADNFKGRTFDARVITRLRKIWKEEM